MFSCGKSSESTEQLISGNDGEKTISPAMVSADEAEKVSSVSKPSHFYPVFNHGLWYDQKAPQNQVMTVDKDYEDSSDDCSDCDELPTCRCECRDADEPVNCTCSGCCCRCSMVHE